MFSWQALFIALHIRAHLECARITPFLPPQGNSGGGTRPFVACSNAYASPSRRGSLHAVPVKPTPYGAGLGLKPAGNGFCRCCPPPPPPLGAMAKGTTMSGYPALAERSDALDAGVRMASR